ncbi:MAG: efflux RND transporter permease subunit [Myxococcota bacterium]|jgi:uncharacterized protein|nr:efflux RND transporter permease subunit [Myxococcota bacterium]
MHRLTDFSLRRPWLTLGGLLALTAVLGFGIPRVEPAFGFRVLLGEGHPAIVALDRMVEEFSGGYPIQIAWECGRGLPCQTVFDEASLLMADALTREILVLPNVTSVVGPANSVILVASDDGITARYFVEGGARAEDFRVLARRVLQDPFWLDDLISADGRAGVIVVQPADGRPQADLELTDGIDDLLEPFRDQGFRFHLMGDAPETVSAGRALAESTNTLIPVLALVISLTLYVLTRSWQQALTAMASMGLALLWTLGLLGWLGWPQDGMLEVLAPLVVIVGVCDAVHLLSAYAEARRRKADLSVQGALRVAARDVSPACLMTTLTSALAFASFTASDLDTFFRFGVVLPAGVLACFLLTFSLLPVVIGLLPPEPDSARGGADIWQPVISSIVETASRRAAPLLIGVFVCLSVFGYGWAVYLRADTDWMEAFGESSDVVQAISFTEASLGGSETLELDIALPPGVQIEAPETLSSLARFSDGLSDLEHLSDPESILGLIRQINRVLHEDRIEYDRFGASISENAELIELIAFDAPETLGRWLSLDRSRLRISMNSRMVAKGPREKALDEVMRRAQRDLPGDWHVQVTGEFAIHRDWIRDVQATQFRSFPIAFAIVFLLVSAFLRSWRLGLAAMVPTLLPVVVVLGAMGWVGMPLDVARAMIAAVVIGIGVDDAIHLLSQYAYRRNAGATIHEAMSGALHQTGRAIVTTSLALALGFLTLMMSAWQTVASFGFFVAIAITGGLVATLLVLPALIFGLTEVE